MERIATAPRDGPRSPDRRRTGTPEGEPRGPAPFRSLLVALPPTPLPARPAGHPAMPAVRVLASGSAPDGSHAASLGIELDGDRRVVLDVLLTRGRLEVRLEAPDDRSLAWIGERLDRIREAVSLAGLDLARLETRSGGDDGRSRQGGSGGEEQGRRRRPAGGRSRGWTL
jgi:hypothetical protein